MADRVDQSTPRMAANIASRWALIEQATQGSLGHISAPATAVAMPEIEARLEYVSD
jgi:hypothetical protein